LAGLQQGMELGFTRYRRKASPLKGGDVRRWFCGL
jgi:hypothetical protein